MMRQVALRQAHLVEPGWQLRDELRKGVEPSRQEDVNMRSLRRVRPDTWDIRIRITLDDRHLLEMTRRASTPAALRPAIPPPRTMALRPLAELRDIPIPTHTS